MPATDFVTMKESHFLTPTGDGVEYGYGVLDTNWLNLRHKHNEGTDQRAIITHYPKEYVEYYWGKPNELKNAGDNIGQTLDPVVKAWIDLQKELADQKQTKPGDKGVDIPTEQGDTGIASAGNNKVHAMFIDGGIISGVVVAALITVGWEALKFIMSKIGDMANQSFKEHTNPDGSLTMILADFYQGSAAKLQHAGWLAGIFNHKEEVNQFIAKMQPMTSDTSIKSFSKNKNLVGRVTLKGLKPGTKPKPKQPAKPPVKQPAKPPVKQPTKPVTKPVTKAPAKKGPAKPK